MAWFASTTTVISKSTIQSQTASMGSHRDLLTHFFLFVGEADNADNFFFIYCRQTINNSCYHLLQEWFNFPQVEGISSAIFNCMSFVNV